MKHEINKKQTFINQSKLLLLAFLAAPLALLGLALLCLGRALISGGSEVAAPELTVELPLAMARQEEDPAAPEPAPETETVLWDQSVTLTVQVGDTVQEMSLGDYLWGVVASEMPASFEQQALNAQACAARTYTVYKLLHPTSAHEADLCSDTGCCQAWISREDRMNLWGADGEAYAAKITEAVQSTDGWAVCYDGSPIQAVFHAASAQTTRSALEVWGTDVPYLQSVSSPEGEDVPNYYSTVTVSAADFAAALPQCDLSGAVESWIGETSYDDAGLSSSVVIGGTSIATTKLRSLFSLRSSSLSVEAAGDTVTFYVTGYGHGVGMSQYGANELAKQGKTWQEILLWYYSGSGIENLADKSLDLG